MRCRTAVADGSRHTPERQLWYRLAVGYDLRARKYARRAGRAERVPRDGSAGGAFAHRFEQPFRARGKARRLAVSLESGPGTPSWVSIDDMSKQLETAILICEDAGFIRTPVSIFMRSRTRSRDDLNRGGLTRPAR